MYTILTDMKSPLCTLQKRIRALMKGMAEAEGGEVCATSPSVYLIHGCTH